MTRPSEARHAASSQLARSVSLHTRSTDGVFGHQSERNLSPRHGAGRASVPRGGRGSRGSRGNRVWAPRGPGEAERVPTPCTRFPVGSSARLESRGVEFSERRGRISQISQLASQRSISKHEPGFAFTSPHHGVPVAVSSGFGGLEINRGVCGVADRSG